MIDPHRLLAFRTMSVLLSAVPGPNALFVIGRALARGRRTAPASVLGKAGAAGPASPGSPRRYSDERGSVRVGFLAGETNPKSMVFRTAMLLHFVDREAGHVTSRC
ncbi:hypothetical protein ACPCVL_03425 [Streptomyces koyangensis]|uniref:hypothetical protein n=1 Tax=Streptomyces koyangensis TaxID=188770 RepID=UPI003C2FB2FF